MLTDRVDRQLRLDLPEANPVITEVTAALRAARSHIAACQAAVAVLSRHTPGLVAALLRVRDRLRTVAAAGGWHVYSSVPMNQGVVGRVLRTGQTSTVTDVAAETDFIALGPDVVIEICAPLTAPDGQPIGVLNVEWTHPVDIEAWRAMIESVSRLLSDRIHQLGGPPAETQTEQLLRHALAITGAADEALLFERSMDAARDMSGLPTVILLMNTPAGVRAFRGQDPPGSLGEHLGRRLSTEDPATLADLLVRARGRGATYTIGDPADHDAHGFEELTSAGVRTMIAIPAGPPSTGGALLVVDDTPQMPDPATVNLLEMLSDHAWTALERMRTERRLRERAGSDPLTGLRHHGPFGERLAIAAPGKTALLAIDVDAFKKVNDTYGHQAGDQALVDLARALQGELRDADDLYRIGGDEFVAVLEVHTDAEARRIAERLCAAARRTGRTISVGVAIQADDEAAELTLRRADTALYEAKRQGRDRVV